ncbi:hypothetical protein D3C81_263790 [compost metagenome]|uniref:Tail fiber protein n=1 Tax=Serratia liquefaciens TaxID=614 RepID=A0ABX7CZD5_SERLI|nr:hypothetical protein [Serratia liquefaciens]QQU53684.1 hypothetical protein I6I38_15220 [Serratia liquefaciens]
MQKIGDITKTADKQGEFTNGSVAEGIEPTELDCQWFNTVQRELIAVLAMAGITTRPENDAQLVEAIKTLLKKGDDEVRKSVYPKEEADKRYLSANTKIPDAWSKTEANKRFQPKGDYQSAGYAYSKKESDKRYLASGTKIPDAYSRTESDKKYQQKGEGVGYSKKDIDNKFSTLGTAAKKNVNRSPEKPDRGAVLCAGDLGIGSPLDIPSGVRLEEFLRKAEGIFYMASGAGTYPDSPEWFSSHFFVFIQARDVTNKIVRLWNPLTGSEAMGTITSSYDGKCWHPHFSGWQRVLSGEEVYTKKEIEKTFLKNTLMDKDTSKDASPVGSVGMFMYRGNVHMPTGWAVPGATLVPACITQTVKEGVYTRGREGMPGTWRNLGALCPNSVCLFVRMV